MDYDRLKKDICNWSYAWAQKIFDEASENNSIWDDLINESNKLINEKPKDLQKLYGSAYMQSLGAYHSFFLNNNQKNDYQNNAMRITEWCIKRIIESESELLENVA